MRGVLDDAVGVYQVEDVVRERQLLAVGHLEATVQVLLGEVGAGQLDSSRGNIDAGDVGPSAGKTGEVDPWAAADVENRTPAVAVKIHEPEQVVQLLEMVRVQIGEKPFGTGRMTGNLHVMNMAVPIVANILDHHIAHYSRNHGLPDGPGPQP